jgi:hypothetical protein
MATKPRTKELCWKLIEKLENDNDLLSDAVHKISNEAQAALIEKDRQLLNKCKTCQRGIK